MSDTDDSKVMQMDQAEALQDDGNDDQDQPQDSIGEGNNPNDSNQSFLTQVFFRPIIQNAQHTLSIFEKEGFDCVHSLDIRDSYGFARFRDRADAERFAEHFHKQKFEGQQMTAELSRKTMPDFVPCRRIHVGGYDSAQVSERELFSIVSKYGFVRKIIYHGDYSFIDLDTLEDAIEVVKKLNKQPIKGRLFTCSYAKWAPSREFSDTNISIPLTSILPAGHPFWDELRHMVSI